MQSLKFVKSLMAVSQITAIINSLEDGIEYVLEVKRYRKKRSNNANKYFWVLCGKLAIALRQDKNDVYKHLIREIGDNYSIVTISNDAVEDYIRNWGEGRLGWVCDIIGDSEIEGYTDICAYYGSSTYDSRQMSALIDSVVNECKLQGIETATPDEIEIMKARYRDNE